MPGKLLNIARRDARKIGTSVGWEEDIKLSSSNQSIPVEIKGWHTKHKIQQITDGGIVASTNVHILLSEQDLILLGYPYKNTHNGIIDLKGHLVVAKNSAGIEVNYVVIETHPSETFGMISCILSELKINEDDF